MPFIFLKRKLFKLFSRKSVEFLLQSKLAIADEQFTEEEFQELKRETTELDDLRERLFPPTLPWKTKLVRIVLIFGVFGSIGAGGYFLVLHPPTIQPQSTKIVESNSAVTTFIPQTKVFVSPNSILKRLNYSNSVPVVEGDGWKGWSIIKLIEHQGSLRLLSLEAHKGERQIMLRTVNTELETIGEPRKLMTAEGMSEGILEKFGTEWALLLIPEAENTPLQLVRFDAEWNTQGEPVRIDASQPLETAHGAALTVLHDSLALITLKLPPDTASVNERAQPILRVLGTSTFSVLEQVVLPGSPELTFIPGASLFPNKDNGFDIVLSGHGALEADAGKVKKGNELYALSYNADRTLKEVFQLTNNGRPHDFLPIEHIAVQGYQLITSLHITGLPQKERDPLGYPPQSGKAFVHAFGPRWSVEGALILDDAEPQFDAGAPLAGVAESRIAYIGDRLYTATIQRKQNTEEGSTEKTAVTIAWQQVPISSTIK